MSSVWPAGSPGWMQGPWLDEMAKPRDRLSDDSGLPDRVRLDYLRDERLVEHEGLVLQCTVE